MTLNAERAELERETGRDLERAGRDRDVEEARDLQRSTKPLMNTVPSSAEPEARLRRSSAERLRAPVVLIESSALTPKPRPTLLPKDASSDDVDARDEALRVDAEAAVDDPRRRRAATSVTRR